MKHMWSEEEIQELISEQGGSGGGGESEVHLYCHYISAEAVANINLTIYSSSNIPFQADTLKTWLNDNGFLYKTNDYIASGYSSNGRIIIGVSVQDSNIYVSFMSVGNDNTLTKGAYQQYSFAKLTDKIIQIL